MTKEEHLEYLETLERIKWNGLVFPYKEGAFFFGGDITLNEYAEMYRQKCIENGWISDGG